MKSLKNIVASLVVVPGLFFVACSGDDGSSASPQDEDPSIETSSSSVTPQSSDSETSVSSSEIAANSSSSRKDNSNSIVTSSSSYVASSSSELSSSSKFGCKTETEDNCEYGELVDERDGRTYKTVKIGKQWWMAENLNYANLQPTTKLDSSSFCYKDSVEYCEKYGRLYLWSAAMDSAGTWSTDGKGCGDGTLCLPTYPVRGVCPEGWHLPDESEWRTLFLAVGGSSFASIKLNSTSGWNGNGNGTDAVSFSALPAGRKGYGGYDSEGYRAFFWTSTKKNGGDNAYSMFLYYDYNFADLGDQYRDYGISVRCLKY